MESVGLALFALLVDLAFAAPATAAPEEPGVVVTGNPFEPLHCSPYCTPDVKYQKGELLNDPDYEFINPREVLPPEKRKYTQLYEATGRNFNNMQGKPIEEVLQEEGKKEIKLNGACFTPSEGGDYKLTIKQPDPSELFSLEDVSTPSDWDALFLNDQQVIRHESNKGLGSGLITRRGQLRRGIWR